MPAIWYVIQRTATGLYWAGGHTWTVHTAKALLFDSEHLARLRAVRDLPDRADAWIAVAVEG